MTIVRCVLAWLPWLWWLPCGIGASSAAAAESAQLPLGFRASAGAYSWTGRLHALAFRTASLSSSAVLTQWEAGEQLDRRDIHGRQLFLGGPRLTPLRWSALDDAARESLGAIEPEQGLGRLAWLRGDLGNQALRPRDTRLASASGARVHLVSPPAWLPMQPGHAAFRQRHVQRGTTVWLGTRDGLLHGIDAITGHERVGYLPRAMLASAAALTAPKGPVPAVPCPRPQSIDADPSGIWRTLLLCGVPAVDTDSVKQPGAVFVLDVSAPDAATPIGLIWEAVASTALPLSGEGPVRAAMWIEHAARRWAAVAIVAPDPATASRAALALLPLDRPNQAWAHSGNVARLALPESGCGDPTETTRLLAATVQSDAGGVAHAAYAIDDRGRLWRFGLGHLSSGGRATPATCLYRQSGAAGDNVEAPLVVPAGAGPLVIYGTGPALVAVPDRPGARGTPSAVSAVPSGDGVVLRTAQPTADPLSNGWTLTLPHPGERIESLDPASPVHLGFTTVAPDGQYRSYLVNAASGESVTVADASGSPAPAITGLPFDGAGGPPIIVTSTIASGPATAPGASARDTFEAGLWRIDGDTAHRMQQARWHRRRGRLSWRELVRVSP